MITCVEICAGAGGQSLGLERAGFGHEALIEIDAHACHTLRLNRPLWDVQESDVRLFNGSSYKGIDMLCGGVPCPPFSVAGKQLGQKDERDLFPEALRLTDEIRPEVVMIENVRGLLGNAFADYRSILEVNWKKLGYHIQWKLLNAQDFGVPQNRPRVIMVGLPSNLQEYFQWPAPNPIPAPSVGKQLIDLMASNGWKGVKEWAKQADSIAPTLVGGSKKHGGADLGPTRARSAWAELGVDGKGLANEAPTADFEGMPRLTWRMAARIQGFPDDWRFVGGKTSIYRQIGNAFPPPVAHAVGKSIKTALEQRSKQRQVRVA